MPVEVEYASEFRYRNPPIDRNTIVLAITPVGRDGRHAGRPARDASARGTRRWPCATSSAARIAREADGGVYLHAGPEIGVASTKAFTDQVTVLTMLALYFGRLRHLSSLAGRSG